MAKAKDYSGKRFGKLTVVERCGANLKFRHAIWKCICDCGKEVMLNAYKLKRNKSCGCGEYIRKHNMSNTRQYIIWRNMISRCLNLKNKSYDRYGGRGITICDKWHTFEGFWEDMQDSYFDRLTLDRIDFNGNYEKNNCRWANYYQQANNTSLNVKYELDGEFYTANELSRIYDIPTETLRSRLKSGMTTEEAISKRHFRDFSG
jgi:hypothetical protein